MFDKHYELSLNKSYVRHWGILEAVRELIQNALDSESPFVYEVSEMADGSYSLILTSEFATLSPQSLLLGATSKADATDKIGSFGEGYKIAMLVLVREGIPVEIWNGDRHWRPFFQYSKKYDDDLLCVKETAMPIRHQGLDFFIPGLSLDVVEGVRESCLQMQDHVGQKHSTLWGDILLEKPGKLYVGGLYICDTKLRYGYNIKPEFMKLERDRKTVDNWDLKTVCRDMWYSTGEMDLVAQMIQDGVPDMEYAEYSAPAIVKEACYKLFRQKYPRGIVAKSQEELHRMVKEGMTNTVFVGSAFGSLVTASSSYRTEVPRAAAKTPHEKLEAWYKEHRYHMHAKSRGPFEELMKEAKNWRWV